MSKTGYVYILASKRNGTLYIGVTSDLMRRMYEHREETIKGFTKTYGVKRLVYFQEAPDMPSAIAREKQLKNWHREWKINWINQHNPSWSDLAEEWFMDPETSSG